MAEATHQDAQILLQLAQLHAQSRVPEAAGWVWSDEFITDYGEFVRKYPRGSEEFGRAGRVAGWYETVETLHKHRLIDQALLFDWLLVTAIWDRMKGFCLGLREEMGDPRLMENFEAMAEAQRSGAS